MSALPNPNDFEDDDKHGMGDHCTEFGGETAGISAGNKLEQSLNITRGAIRDPSPNPSLLSIVDSDNIRYGRHPNYFADQNGHRYASRSPAPTGTIKGRMRAVWYKNKGLFLVLISQFFGTLMNITTRLLEMEGNDGTLAICTRSIIADSVIRQGIPPVSHTLCSHGNYSIMCIRIYVA